MKNFIKILLLMVLGFGMGAIAATLKKPRTTTPPAVTAAASPDAPAPAEQPHVAQSLTDPDATPLTTGLGDAVAVEEPAAVIIKGPEVTPDEAKRDAGVAAPQPAQSSPAPAVSVSFLLTDHNGVAVTEKSWPGKYLLVFFGFTNCPDICPTALEKFGVVLEKLGADAAKAQVLFITVDPARDNAAAMKEYVAKFDKSILGLTGTDEQVKAAIAAFKVYAAKGEEASAGHYLMDHSGFTYFTAPDGQVKEVIKMSETADEMVAKIKPVLESAP